MAIPYIDVEWIDQTLRTARLAQRNAKGRKARWKLRHAMHVKHRRKPHPQREARRVQRFIANWDAMQKLAGAALALCLLMLGGCGAPTSLQPPYAARRCVEAAGESENAAIIACAEAANPKSDEEGEDLVAECARTMRGSLCARWEWFYEQQRCGKHSCSTEKTVICARGNDAQKRLCMDQGWRP
jgi:hypothetical protein